MLRQSLEASTYTFVTLRSHQPTHICLKSGNPFSFQVHYSDSWKKISRIICQERRRSEIWPIRMATPMLQNYSEKPLVKGWSTTPRCLLIPKFSHQGLYMADLNPETSFASLRMKQRLQRMQSLCTMSLHLQKPP